MDRTVIHRIFWNAHVRREKLRDRNPEKRIHTDLVFREILPFVREGVKVLDAGGGYGRYSLELARRGCQVVHLDLSPRMLREAQELVREAGFENRVTFVCGKVQDLSAFADESFDLVLSLDAPVSYAYPEEKRALRELCRVTGRTLVLSVVNRLGQLPVVVEREIHLRKSLALSWQFFKNGNWDHPSFFQAMEERMPFLARFLFPPLHAFLPKEIVDAVEDCGLEVRRIVATGSLTRLLSRRTLRTIVRNPKLYEEFLELSRLYDAQFEVLGVGSRVASGLLLVAERKHSGAMV